MNPIFFASAADFRKWLEQNFDQQKEIWVGFYKVKSGKFNLSWSDAVDQALCFGWIDGIRKSIDDYRYTIRFTPRNIRSTWSNVNIEKVKVLTKKNLMHPAGLAVFKKRKKENYGLYSFEQDKHDLSASFLKVFRKHKAAYNYFLSQPPYYRKTSVHWVMQAKREETREKRFNILLDCSARQDRIPLLKQTPRK